jgi:SPOR domain
MESMTKWIVGLLLLANVALFGWMRWGSALTVDMAAVPAQAGLNADKIKLLPGVPAASAPVPASAPAVPSVNLASASVPVPATIAAPSAPVAASAPLGPVASVAKSSRCAEWGEFSGNDLVRVRQALGALNLGEGLSERSVEHKLGYWVYIPPLKKRADLHRKVAQLKERGVRDYFVVQEKGKWLNAISLGVFRTKDSAEKYIGVLRSKDVHSARLGERVVSLKFTVFVMKGIDGGMADKLDALRKDFPDSELIVSACGN